MDVEGTKALQKRIRYGDGGEAAFIKAGQKTKEFHDVRRRVKPLLLKGYPRQEIAEKLGVDEKKVEAAMRHLEAAWQMKRTRGVEYYRNRSRQVVEIAMAGAWEIYDQAEAKPSVKLSALRVVKELAGLMAQIDGIMAEKMVAGPEKRATELMAELRKLAEAKVAKVEPAKVEEPVLAKVEEPQGAIANV
jgi:hypothetical protein